MAVEGKVAIIIVTYNRLECLKRSIINNLNQSYKNICIYIVDNNSSDGTDSYCRDMESKEDRIIYHRLDENKGGAYGFYYGIMKAMEDNCEFVWGMDDDAYPQQDALSVLLQQAQNYGLYKNGFWSNINSHTEYEKGKVEVVKGWTFCGFFLSISLIKEIGLPWHELFIFFDDAEYGQRITNTLKRNIYRVNDSIVIHDGTLAKQSDDDYWWKVVFGLKTRKLAMRKLPNWKYYYLARNRILIHKKPKDAKEWWSSLGASMRMLIKSVIIHPEYSKYIMQGIIDGIRNKDGIVVRP